MMKRHTEVAKNTVDTLDTVIAEEITQKTEVAVYKCKSTVVDCVVHSIGVLIKSIKATIPVKSLNYRTRMSATTECDIHIDTIGLNIKPLQCFIKQCRYVVNFLFHSARQLGCKVSDFIQNLHPQI